ncbi:AAA family ATPase [Donghicola sp. XS_ASV15]|uniref:ATP-binding protein n=1 Tax=Donghicola sp. XS_ASV15 TaxID=3241295 RepID=UPI003517C4CB
MRLRQLTLERFGRFSGKIYDFGAKPDGTDFHVIYGPNEAGKTTTMEGFLRLLYGYPLQDPYAFQHQRKNLSISGILDIEGNARHFTRLPLRSDGLTDANGIALPENAIKGLLNGLDEAEYRKLLCLDDETIEKGGDEIASSKGDIGRLLFSAAAGISDLTAVLDQVQKEADELHKHRASRTRLAALKKEREAIEKRIKELDVPASAYRKLKQAFETCDQEQNDLIAERTRLRTEKGSAEQRAAALPQLAEIDRRSEALVDVANFPKQLDINPEDLVALVAAQTQHRADQERLRKVLSEKAAQRDSIHRDPASLALQGELSALEDLRARNKGASRDLGRRQQQLVDAQAEMALIARQCGAPPEALEKLVVDDPTLHKLDMAREAAREAHRLLTAEQGELDKLQEKLQRAEADRPEATEATTTFTELLASYGADRLAASYAVAKQAVATSHRDYRAALSKLSTPHQTFDTSPNLPIAKSDAEDLALRIQAAQQQQAEREATAEALATDLRAKSARIAQLKSGIGVISDHEAKVLLSERDQLWTTHQKSMDAETASAFEIAMRAYDTASDQRLHHARDLGELRQLEADLAEVTVRHEDALKHLELARQSSEAADTELRDACKMAGFPEGLPPARFVSWVTALEQAQSAERALRETEHEFRPVLERGDALAAEIAEQLSLEAPEFDSALDQARTKAAEEQTAQEALRTRQELLRSLRADLTLREASVLRAQDAAAHTNNAWTNLVRDVFDHALLADALEQSLDPLRKLREADIRRQQFQRQVSTMAKDQEAFHCEVQSLANRYGPTAAGDAEALYESLAARAAAAQEAEKHHQTLTREIAEAEAHLAEATSALQQIDTQVHELGAIFPEQIATETLADLRAAVTQGHQVIAERTALSDLTQSFLSGLNLSDLTDARVLLAGQTQPELTERVAELDAQLDANDAALQAAIAARSATSQALNAVTGDSEIAQLTEQKSTIELEMQDVALKHLELKLGHRLAEEAIRRYRDAHRSGMMQSAEDTFAALTNGAYARLDTVVSGQTETLIAYDAAGQAKQAKDLSKGTRFQLYLALRAAAYDQLAGQGQTLPFFCDDIFETFDEDRTRSACQVLSRIGQNGQAIYLTHHRHVVDIAKEVCGSNVTIHAV